MEAAVAVAVADAACYPLLFPRTAHASSRPTCLPCAKREFPWGGGRDPGVRRGRGARLVGKVGTTAARDQEIAEQSSTQYEL